MRRRIIVITDKSNVDDLQAEIQRLREELTEERYRHDRLQDFEVAEAKELAEAKAYIKSLEQNLRELRAAHIAHGNCRCHAEAEDKSETVPAFRVRPGETLKMTVIVKGED